MRNSFGVYVATLTARAISVRAGFADSHRDQAPHAQKCMLAMWPCYGACSAFRNCR
jgi:hypothetical protein